MSDMAGTNYSTIWMGLILNRILFGLGTPAARPRGKTPLPAQNPQALATLFGRARYYLQYYSDALDTKYKTMMTGLVLDKILFERDTPAASARGKITFPGYEHCEAGSYLRFTDFVYHATLGLKVTKRPRKKP